ncbi:hypothetical protein AB0J86_30165 [Micromonospora sp. NPDC049559]|uniref:hypothetical protein n=1 Tax=Micromonospora sp. NPDC049559 TaxID=3155923 RepID=UPI0034414831
MTRPLPGSSRDPHEPDVHVAPVKREGQPAHQVVALQQTVGNRATAAFLLGQTTAHGPVAQRAVTVQRSWLGDRIAWVRTAIGSGNWQTSDPPGAYYVLNGLSMDDMVRLLRALTAAERKTLADNLEEHGGGSDRPRIHLAITNASAPPADAAFRERSENLLWAIRSGNFSTPPNAAFQILVAVPASQRSRVVSSLNRDALDALIDHRDEAGSVPGAAAALMEIDRQRGKQGPSKPEQHLIDLVEGRAWSEFFRQFNGMQEFDQLRFLRGNQGVIPPIRDNVQKANGIGDPARIQYLLQRATTPTSQDLYVDAMVHAYSWQPKYLVEHPMDLSRIIRFGSLVDIEIDINTISDDESGEDDAERQYREAKPGPGGLLWPEIRNRSTLPVLWQVKQMVRREQETILGDEVLTQGIFVVQYLLNVVFPIAQSSAIRSLSALRSARVTGRWMRGSQMLKPPTGPAAPSGRGVWDLPAPARGRAVEGLLKAQLPGEKFYGNFPNLDRAVYSAGGAEADAIEVGQLKSYDAVKGYKKPGAFYNSLMKNAGELGGMGESQWSGGGKSVTIGKNTVRVLDVALPADEALPAANQTQLDAAITGAKSIGVEIRVHRIK